MNRSPNDEDSKRLDALKAQSNTWRTSSASGITSSSPETSSPETISPSQSKSTLTLSDDQISYQSLSSPNLSGKTEAVDETENLNRFRDQRQTIDDDTLLLESESDFDAADRTAAHPEDSVPKTMIKFGLKDIVPIINKEATTVLLRIQDKYLESHPCLCTSRFRHSLHQLSLEKHQILQMLCYRLHNIFEHQQEDNVHQPLAVDEYIDIVFEVCSSEMSSDIQEQLKTILRRLISEYRAIFAIEDESSRKMCENFDRIHAHDNEHRKRHEEEDDCPEEMKLMKVAWNELTLHCSSLVPQFSETEGAIGGKIIKSNLSDVESQEEETEDVCTVPEEEGDGVTVRSHAKMCGTGSGEVVQSWSPKQGHHVCVDEERKVDGASSSSSPCVDAINKCNYANCFKNQHEVALKKPPNHRSPHCDESTSNPPMAYVHRVSPNEGAVDLNSPTTKMQLDSHSTIRLFNKECVEPLLSSESVCLGNRSQSGAVAGEEECSKSLRSRHRNDSLKENMDNISNTLNSSKQEAVKCDADSRFMSSLGISQSPLVNHPFEKQQPITWLPHGHQHALSFASAYDEQAINPRFCSPLNSPRYLEYTPTSPRRSPDPDAYYRHQRKIKSKQLTKQLEIVQLKISKLEADLELRLGYRPSHAEKQRYKCIKALFQEQIDLKQKLRRCRERTDLWLDYCDPDSGDEAMPIVNNNDAKSRDLVAMKSYLLEAKQRLAENRLLKNRPYKLEDMNLNEIVEEKCEMQIAITEFENLFGNPETPDERAVCKDFFDRYRNIKRSVRRSSSSRSKESTTELETIPEDEVKPFTLASPPHRINIEMGGDDKVASFKGVQENYVGVRQNSPYVSIFNVVGRHSVDGGTQKINKNLHALSRSELRQELRWGLEEKRYLRGNIKESEKNYFAENGRRLMKNEKNGRLYDRYRAVKSRLKLIEALLSKQ